MSSLTVLVMGKGGVGKSSTVNSVIGEKAAAVSTFQVPSLMLFSWLVFMTIGYLSFNFSHRKCVIFPLYSLKD